MCVCGRRFRRRFWANFGPIKDVPAFGHADAIAISAACEGETATHMAATAAADRIKGSEVSATQITSPIRAKLLIRPVWKLILLTPTN